MPFDSCRQDGGWERTVGPHGLPPIEMEKNEKKLSWKSLNIAKISFFRQSSLSAPQRTEFQDKFALNRQF